MLSFHREIKLSIGEFKHFDVNKLVLEDTSHSIQVTVRKYTQKGGFKWVVIRIYKP